MEKSLYYIEGTEKDNNKIDLYDEREIALINSVNGDDLYFNRFTDDKRCEHLVERVPVSLEKLFGVRRRLVEVKNYKTNNLIKIGDHKYEALNDMPKEKIILIKNAYDSLSKINNSDILKIHKYPDKPVGIDEDDSDLIVYSVMGLSKEEVIKKLNKLLLVHPELIYKVNDYLTGINFNYQFREGNLIKNYEILLKNYCKKLERGEEVTEEEKIKIELIYMQYCSYFMYDSNLLKLIDLDFNSTIDSWHRKKLIRRVDYKREKGEY